MKKRKRETKKREPKKREAKKIRLNLFTLLVMFSLVPLILSIGIISTTSLYMTKSNLEKEAKDTLFIVANNLASYCLENDINAMNASNYYEYLDSLKEQNIEMAIILDGIPCATSIKNENDYRIREIEVNKDLVADKEELEKGYYDEIVIDGKYYCAYYMPIKANGEMIGVAFAGELRDKITGAVDAIMINYVGIAVLLILVFTIIALILSKNLSKSLAVIGKNVSALSEGSLDRQKNRSSMVKEMDMLLTAAASMQENLSGTIGKVKDLSHGLAGNIEDTAELSTSSMEKAKQSTSVVEELSTSAIGMAEHVQDINMQMLEIGNCVNDISESVEHLSERSGNILHINDEAKKNMRTIIENSQRSVDAVSDITKQIKQTNDSIVEIDKAVELILNISEQTNLLSLNASIEASRAGAQGRGFTVVAQEIRSLSEQSAVGAEMIKNLAQEIRQKSQRSVMLSDNVYCSILEEQKDISKTQKKYEELSSDIDQSVQEIQSIAEKTGHLTNYKEKVIDNVRSLSDISQENAANSKEVNANICEIITEVQVVNKNCAEMKEISGELEESVSYFTITETSTVQDL